MRRFLYIVNEAGRELPGSRRSLDHCTSPPERYEVERALAQIIGEGCHIRDTLIDGAPDQS